MSKYRIHHKHYGGEDYYNAEILIEKRSFFGRDISFWYPLRGEKGYNGSYEDAKTIIDDAIAEELAHGHDYDEYLKYP